METLRLVALDDNVAFPGMTVTLPVDLGEETRAVLVPKRGDGYAQVGVIAEVANRLRLPGRSVATALSGIERALLGRAQEDDGGTLRVEVEPHPDVEPEGEAIETLASEFRALADEILELRGDDGRIRAFVRSIEGFGPLADAAGYSPDLSIEQKVQLLEMVDVAPRLRLSVDFLRQRLAELQLRKRVRDEVDASVQKDQRQHMLRRQIESLRKELGEDETSVVEEYRKQIAEAGMPEKVREQAERELDRFERMGEQHGESAMIRNYLDWMLGVPWSKRSEEQLDPQNAREILDADHAGLDDVKRRVVEHLAVRKLRAERGIDEDRRSGAILTLVGPPGTGKTSIGESIAKAMGREFVRIALGGVRDEAEIRGHRRTYVGALPGRLVRALRDAETMNPVILLDEVDKLGADWRGDPSSALLEVLDPAQNHTFRDHYLDVDVDLSEVLFLATANVDDEIPAALRDRMEIVRFDGYTEREKREIARDYLLPRQVERNGLRPDEVTLGDDRLDEVVSRYTKEAGVRQLERELGKLLRKTATKIASGEIEGTIAIDEAGLRDALGRPKFHRESAERTSVPGVATGLAVTGMGGDVLFVEASAMNGKRGLVLTGQLGDVMKESAEIALSYVRSHAEALGITAEDLSTREVHLHVPAGAVPKDGPSAGITMATAMASLFSGRPVRSNVGMTGEVTLQGHVLPIGGLKQKVLAAHAAGLTDVVLPERNRDDLEDVPADVRDAMKFHPVRTLEEVFAVVLQPVGAKAEKGATSKPPGPPEPAVPPLLI